MAGRNLCAVLLSSTKPEVNGLFAGQTVKLLGTKPLAPITVPLAAVTSDTGATEVFWYGQAAKHFGGDVIKRGAAGAKLLVAVRATVITAEQHGITPSPFRLLPRNQRRPVDLMIHCWHLAGETFRFQATTDHPRSQ